MPLICENWYVTACNKILQILDCLQWMHKMIFFKTFYFSRLIWVISIGYMVFMIMYDFSQPDSGCVYTCIFTY